MFGNLTESEASIISALIGALVVIVITVITFYIRGRNNNAMEKRKLRKQVYEEQEKARNVKLWEAIKSVSRNNERLTGNLKLLTTTAEQLHNSVKDMAASQEKRQALLEQNQKVQVEKWESLKEDMAKMETNTNRQIKQVLDITSKHGDQIAALITLCGTSKELTV